MKKSILKASPAGSDTNINKSLRAALIERDEKRIQFSIDKDDEKLELQVLLILEIYYTKQYNLR